MRTNTISEDTLIYINMIKTLCFGLDYLAKPNLEETMVCSLDCCIGNEIVGGPLSRLIENNDKISGIIGSETLQLLHQFKEAFDDAILIDEEKGFSKKPDWAIFIKLVDQLNSQLKKSIALYKDK